MKYVYILQSELDLNRCYVGITDNLERRLEEHNSGKSIHTNKFKPWKIKTYIAFSDYKKAEEFETFLKTGNGRVFVKKRL
jgi:predicted GIY-YIG superfamily endonuclease